MKTKETMIQVKFKNLERSELAREAVIERVSTLVDKFQALQASRITVTLEMENSPTQAGPDTLSAKLHISGGRYDGITVSKSHHNLYIALADLIDHMLEKLNRASDRERVKKRSKARKFALETQAPEAE